MSHEFPPEGLGGVGQHVDGLATALHSSGHRVHVYTRTGEPGPQGERIDAQRGRPHPVTRVRYRWEDLEGLDDLYEVPALDAAFGEFLKEHSFDVAHVHHLTGMSTGTVAQLAARGIPVVMTLHDYWMMCPRGQMWHADRTVCETIEPTRCTNCLRGMFGSWLEGDAGEQAVRRLHTRSLDVLQTVDRLVVPSSRAIPPFAALGIPEDKITVVENGVDTGALHGVPDPTGNDGRPLRLGYLGTLIPSKGLDVLVGAVCRQEGGASLDIWGNAVSYHGDEGFLTRVFQQLRPQDQIHYHGPYRTPNLPGILERVDVVAAPALWAEAYGLTVREALAAGRPILASRIGGLQDAIEDRVAGRILPPGDVEAWSAAIAELAADRDLLRTYAAAARRHPRGFEAMARDLEEVYAGAKRA